LPIFFSKFSAPILLITLFDSFPKLNSQRGSLPKLQPNLFFSFFFADRNLSKVATDRPYSFFFYTFFLNFFSQDEFGSKPVMMAMNDNIRRMVMMLAVTAKKMNGNK
jgi:hypothetical protein